MGKRSRKKNRGRSSASYSQVLHATSLPPECHANDLLECLCAYGSILDVSMLPDKSEAFVTFADAKAIRNCLTAARRKNLLVNNKPFIVKISDETSSSDLVSEGATNSPMAEGNDAAAPPPPPPSPVADGIEAVSGGDKACSAVESLLDSFLNDKAASSLQQESNSTTEKSSKTEVPESKDQDKDPASAQVALPSDDSKSFCKSACQRVLTMLRLR